MTFDALDTLGARIPVATVVTDLGSAHFSWFDPRVDEIVVPSSQDRQLAVQHGFAREKIFLCGLLAREKFWHCPESQSKVVLKKQLGLRGTVVLLMGGGGGFDAMFKVAEFLGNVHCQLVVICGRNEAGPFWFSASRLTSRCTWAQLTASP